MGYSHHWYRKVEISQAVFDKIVLDFVAIQPYVEDFTKTKLCGWDGTGMPEISTEGIKFNGCKDKEEDYETFFLPRVQEPPPIPEFLFKPDYFYWFCKTDRLPYDTMACVTLLIAKHHLGQDFLLRTDGDLDGEWLAARRLCQAKLGYGMDFTKVDEKPEPVHPPPKPIAVINTQTGEGYMVVAEVDSSDRNEPPYQIKAHSDGVLECECKGWKFCKGDKRHKRCRHIREFEMYITTNGRMGSGVRLINNPLLDILRGAYRGGM